MTEEVLYLHINPENLLIKIQGTIPPMLDRLHLFQSEAAKHKYTKQKS